MRKVTVSMFVTLDGVMESPDKWSFPFWNDEIAKFKFDELFASGALLLGRVTYQGFAAAWPSMKDEQGYADRMNSLPKHVVSTTLQKAAWNNSSLIKENIAEQISQLKQQPGQDLLVFGSGELVQMLMQHDLVDEYRLLVYPIVVGSGKHLFQVASKTNLKLVESKPFSSGVVALVYQPARQGR
jgi:dihydrofolate reductase